MNHKTASKSISMEIWSLNPQHQHVFWCIKMILNWRMIFQSTRLAIFSWPSSASTNKTLDLSIYMYIYYIIYVYINLLSLSKLSPFKEPPNLISINWKTSKTWPFDSRNGNPTRSSKSNPPKLSRKIPPNLYRWETRAMRSCWNNSPGGWSVLMYLDAFQP